MEWNVLRHSFANSIKHGSGNRFFLNIDVWTEYAGTVWRGKYSLSDLLSDFFAINVYGGYDFYVRYFVSPDILVYQSDAVGIGFRVK